MTFEPEHASKIIQYLAILLLTIGACSFAFHRLGKHAFVYLAGLSLYGTLVAFLAFKIAPEVFEIANMAAYGVFIGGPLILVIAALIARRHKLAITSYFYGAIALLVMAIGIDAFLIEPHWLETTYYTVETKKLSKPMKIAVISDIQFDRLSDYEVGVMKKVMDEKPDLILFPGDYVQCLTLEKKEAEMSKFRDLLVKLGVKAPLGAFAVRGNAEWTSDWISIFKDLPITAIEKTRTVDIGPATVTGLSFDDSFNPNVKIPAQDKFSIVFGHGPNFALAYPPADLLVAGHTHGGQVRLPGLGPIITLCLVPRSWAAGLTKISPTTTLVVSRGIGMERRYAPRLRFLCRPQLVFITLKPALQ